MFYLFVFVFIDILWFFTFFNKLEQLGNSTGLGFSYAIDLIETDEGWFFVRPNGIIAGQFLYFFN